MEHHEIGQVERVELQVLRGRLSGLAGRVDRTRGDMHRLVGELCDEYHTLVRQLLVLLDRHTRRGEDPLVDRLLRQYGSYLPEQRSRAN